MANKYRFIAGSITKATVYTCPEGYQAAVINFLPESNDAYYSVNEGITFTSGSSQKILLDSGDSLQSFKMAFSLVEMPVATNATGNFLALKNFNLVKTSALPSLTSNNVAFPYTDYWTDLAFGNGYFVAISGGNNGNGVRTDGAYAAYSSDGNTWNTVATPYAEVTALGFDGINFLAIRGGLYAAGTPCYYSATGSSWGPFPVPDGQWNAITSSPACSVVVGGLSASQTTLFTIPKGLVSYTSYTLPAAGYLRDVAYGNSIFVALGTSYSDYTGTTQTAYRCTNMSGTSWEAVTLPSGYAWNSVAYGNGKFVAVPVGTAQQYNVCAVSLDGANWTLVYLNAPIFSSRVRFYNGKFVILCGNYGTGASKLYTSTDGALWTEVDIPITGRWFGITYGRNTWLLCSGRTSVTSNFLYKSFDNLKTIPASGNIPASINKSLQASTGLLLSSGVNLLSSSNFMSSGFTRTTLTGSVSNMRYVNNRWFVFTSSSNAIWSSVDGITFTQITNPNAGIQFVDIIWDGTNYLLVPFGSASFYSSTNLTSWTVKTSSLGSKSYCGGVFLSPYYVTVDPTSANTYHSSNMTTWSSTAVASACYNIFKLSSVNKLLAVAQNSKVAFISDTGYSWEEVTLPNTSFSFYELGGKVYLEDIEHNLYETSEGYLWKYVRNLGKHSIPLRVNANSTVETYNATTNALGLIY